MARFIPVSSPEAIEEAVVLLRDGRLVALPTETVYGLGADATNGGAVAAIFEAKGRPRFNPLICHIGAFAMAESIAHFSTLARMFADRFWPGPLTLVLPAAAHSPVHPLAQAGLPTVAVRMPRGIARDIVTALGRPIAAPSANRSGKVSPTTAAHVDRSLGNFVDLILDAGPCDFGIESTILKLEGDDATLLRAGAVPVEAIEAATGKAVLRQGGEAGIEAPGQMRSHYAPSATVRLDAGAAEPGEWLVKFGGVAVAGEASAAGVIDLSPSGDLKEAAARLFAVLTELDRPDVARIAVSPIPREGLGEAINDRLARAAAPRD